MTNTPFIGNRRSADQAPQITSTQPDELVPGHESVEASLTAVLHVAPGTNVGEVEVGTHYDDTERSSFLSDLLQSPLLPPAPANIFGRDAIIEDLLGFADRFASVTLFGAGGVGKTAIALTLLHHDRIAARFGKHRYLIRCDDLAGSLDDLPGRLSDAFGAHHPMDVAQLRSHLALSPPCTLVLDGVDPFLDPLAPGSAEIAAAIEEFGRCQNVFLLTTSRLGVSIPDFRRMEVPTLHLDGARDTFHSRCHLGRSVAVDKLLTELDFHALSIDLLASATRENDWDEPRLLKEWNDHKTGILKALGLEDNIKSILLTPTIRQLGNAAQDTLKAIALYPGGVQEIKLERNFPGIAAIGEAVNALCKFSVMYRQDGFVKMLSPFRLYFLESNQPVIYHPGGDAARDSSANDDIQYIHDGIANPGLCFSFYRFWLRDNRCIQ